MYAFCSSHAYSGYKCLGDDVEAALVEVLHIIPSKHLWAVGQNKTQNHHVCQEASDAVGTPTRLCCTT